MGSKSRIGAEIAKYIDSLGLTRQMVYEVFSGGCNLTQYIKSRPLTCIDINPYLIAMWESLSKGDYSFVREYSKDEYLHIKNNTELYPKYVVGYVGFNMSYCGKFFGGYAGVVETKGGVRNYPAEAVRNIKNQAERIKNIDFVCTDFMDFNFNANSVVYFDPPYKGTTGYGLSFDYHAFYNKCRALKAEGCHVFVSEYNMPDDFSIIWEKKVKSSLSVNGVSGRSKESYERLFKL